jgi:hypothetical protein
MKEYLSGGVAEVGRVAIKWERSERNLDDCQVD